MQETLVQSLIWEDPTCLGATKPLHTFFMFKIKNYITLLRKFQIVKAMVLKKVEGQRTDAFEL